ARLSDKYGTPNDIERWQYPYDEDDDPDHFYTALSTGKLTYGCAFQDWQLTLQIDSDLDLSVYYDSPNWEAERLRRQKASTDVF
ncbi:MAG: hypothetical protein HOO17_04190, partial [Bacteroidetes Order II. Incertae sedis bacterium]|nr:hypothetical protein [Bacteroidetes Order II. bacterium]